MLNLDSPRFKQIIYNSAALRGERNFEAAIKLVESELQNMEEECLENAYLEIIYAADEMGKSEICKKYAILLEQIHPGFPAAKKYLK